MTTGMGADTSRGLNGGSGQGQRLQDAAGGLVDQATRTAEAQASTTMTKVGETLDQVASAIREAGSGLRESQPEIAGFVDTAAERVSGASSYLRDHDAGEAIEAAQRTAREQPALVIGGGLALGLILGRILRGGASAAQQSGSEGYGAYGGGSYGTGYGTGYGGTSTGGYDVGNARYGVGTTGSVAGTGYGAASGTGSDLGTSDDIGVSDDFATTDTTAVDTADVLGDETGTGRRRGG